MVSALSQIREVSKVPSHARFLTDMNGQSLSQWTEIRLSLRERAGSLSYRETTFLRSERVLT